MIELVFDRALRERFAWESERDAAALATRLPRTCRERPETDYDRESSNACSPSIST